MKGCLENYETELKRVSVKIITNEYLFELIWNQATKSEFCLKKCNTLLLTMFLWSFKLRTPGIFKNLFVKIACDLCCCRQGVIESKV